MKARKTIKTFRARPNKKRKRSADVEMLSRRISKMQKTIETKSGTRTIGDGDEFLHNNLYAINSTFLHTSSGTLDIENNVDQRTSTLGMQDLSFSDFCVFFFFSKIISLSGRLRRDDELFDILIVCSHWSYNIKSSIKPLY
jgi:hypothetical protein